MTNRLYRHAYELVSTHGETGVPPAGTRRRPGRGGPKAASPGGPQPGAISVLGHFLIFVSLPPAKRSPVPSTRSALRWVTSALWPSVGSRLTRR